MKDSARKRGHDLAPSLFPTTFEAREHSEAPPPRIAPLKPSPVYDTYWRFAAERQEVFFRRLERRPPPLTDDPILVDYKFTNAYRASDRVSQYLIRRVIYREDLPSGPGEVCFRILLFKTFNGQVPPDPDQLKNDTVASAT